MGFSQCSPLSTKMVYNGTLSAFKDITEQKACQEKLVEGEKRP